MSNEKKKSIILLALVVLPFLLHAQIDRFKMYEKKPEIPDTNDLREYDADSIKNDNYKVGYFNGKKYAEEHNANNSSNVIGPPILEPKMLKEISSKQNEDANYQQGFEDGYYGKSTKEYIEESNVNSKDDTQMVAIVLICLYVLALFFPVLL